MTDESWEADVVIDPVAGGRFVAVLVFTPPPELGGSIRVPIEGEHDTPMAAEQAALDAFAAMTRAE